MYTIYMYTCVCSMQIHINTGLDICVCKCVYEQYVRMYMHVVTHVHSALQYIQFMMLILCMVRICDTYIYEYIDIYTYIHTYILINTARIY